MKEINDLEGIEEKIYEEKIGFSIFLLLGAVTGILDFLNKGNFIVFEILFLSISLSFLINMRYWCLKQYILFPVGKKRRKK